MSSQAILKKGKGKAWQIRLADEAIKYEDDGYIYQQDGVGIETYVIHTCKNLGEPFDSARHRAAAAVWDAVEGMKNSKGKGEKNQLIKKLRTIWDETK